MKIVKNSGVTVKIVEIGPKDAAKFLENNDDNRSIKWQNLERISNDMTTGRFSLNGESIIISNKGKLLDGQHRLKACVKTGESFVTILVEGVDEAEKTTIDIGSSRALSDILAFSGWPASNTIAATLRILCSHEAGEKVFETRGGRKVSNRQAVAYMRANPKIIDSLHFCARQSKNIIAPSRLTWLHYLATQNKLRDEVETFISKIGHGIGLSATDPVYHLRTIFLNKKVVRERVETSQALKYITHAWNMSLSGARCRKGLELPKVLGKILLKKPAKKKTTVKRKRAK
jgi:hypothetical protein